MNKFSHWLKELRKKHIFFFLILALLVIVTIYDLGKPILQTDEAELYFASQRIYDTGVPKGFYNIQFYENALLVESNSSMYAYEPTNYPDTNSDLVLRKGWLPYYITAFSSLFGTNEFILRFPFALIGILAGIFIYLLAKKLYNERTALIAMFIYTLSPTVIYYDRFAKYYSPMLLFVITTTYFFIKAQKEKKYFLHAAISLTLLFYTNIMIFVAMVLFIALASVILKPKLRDLIKTGLIVFITTVPWLLLTSFRITFEPRYGFERGIWEGIKIILLPINKSGVLSLLFYLAIIILLIKIKEKNSQFLLAFVFSLIIIPFFLAPATTYSDRAFLPLIVPMCLMIALVIEMGGALVERKIKEKHLRQKKAKAKNKEHHKKILVHTHKKLLNVNIIIILILLTILIPVDSLWTIENYYQIKPYNIFNLQRVNPYIGLNTFVQEQNISKEDILLLATEEQFSAMYYTGIKTQLIWPVRKSFIDNYQGNLIILEQNSPEGTCNFFHKYVEPKCFENKTYLDRVSKCEKQVYQYGEDKDDKNATFYFCKKRNNYLEGTNGLFFNDFPEGMPPDFIWDKNEFEVGANVYNYGEADVDKLKIQYTGEFAKEKYDAKKEFTFDTNLSAAKRNELGEIEYQHQLFRLGGVTYKYKLLQKQVYTNVSLNLCYPYKTMLRVNICPEEKKICGFQISSSPVQPKWLEYKGLKINFTIDNFGNGKMTDFQTCKNNVSKEIIPLNSKYFSCEYNGYRYVCRGDNSKIEKGKSYLISFNFDYLEEFKKSILLRSRELNKYDFNNFKNN